MTRREVRVAHGRRDARVTEELLHGFERRALHDEMAGEGVPLVVPGDATQTRLLEEARKKALIDLLGPRRPIGLAEDAWPPQVTAGLKRRDQAISERHGP